MTRSPLFPIALVLAALSVPGCTVSPDDAPHPPPLTEGAIAPHGASGLALAVLGDEPIVAWVDAEQRFTVRPSGADPVVVHAGPVSSHSQAGPRLHALSDGTLIAAFVAEREVEGRRFPASELLVARSDDGGRSWDEPVRPYSDPGFPTGHSFHSLAVGPGSAVAVAWLDGTRKDQWRRGQPREDEAHAEHGAHHGGSAEAPGTELRVAVSQDGGRSFSPPVTVATNTCQCCRTALHFDGDVLYTAWRHLFPNSERDMALARSDDGGRSWTEPARIHQDGWALDGCPHSGPALVTDADGTLYAAWSTGAEGRSGLWHAYSDDRGATFSEPHALDSPAPLGQVRAVRHGGRATFAFESRDTVSVFSVGIPDSLLFPGYGADLAASAQGLFLLWRGQDGTALEPLASGTPSP